MPHEYYTLVDGESYGPFHVSQMVEMLEKKEIHSETLCAQDGDSEWKPVGEVFAWSRQPVFRNTAGVGVQPPRSSWGFLAALCVTAVMVAVILMLGSTDGGLDLAVFIYAVGCILIGLAVYFVPSYVAHCRNHRNLPALFALNLLLGWTILGWAGAMVWAMYRERADSERVASR